MGRAASKQPVPHMCNLIFATCLTWPLEVKSHLKLKGNSLLQRTEQQPIAPPVITIIVKGETQWLQP